MFNRQPVDVFSVIHFLVSTIFVFMLQYGGVGEILAAGIVFTLGIGWELLDDLCRINSPKIRWIRRFLDVRGGSWEDIGFDLAGCVAPVMFMRFVMYIAG